MFIVPMLPITSDKVITMSQACSELSAQIAQPIKVSKPLQQELVFIHPAGELPRNLVRDLAYAVHATVREQSGKLEIVRTNKDLNSIQQTRESIANRWIEQALTRISKFRKVARQGKTADEAYYAALAIQKEQVNEFVQGKRKSVDQLFPEYVLPSEDLLEKIVKRIGPRTFAQIPTGSSRVFQVSAIGDAIELPNCQDLIETFVQEMSTFASRSPTPQNKFLSHSFRGSETVAQWGKCQYTAKLRLRVYAEESSISFWLDGFDVQGNKVFGASCGVGPQYEFVDTTDSWAQFDTSPKSNHVRLEEASLKALTFLAQGTQQALPPWFLNPEKNEPLNLFVKDALTSLVSTCPNKPVIVSVQDTLWSTFRRPLSQPTPSLRSILDAIKNWSQYECCQVGQATILRSLDPRFSEESHADRKNLGRFARTLSTSTAPTLPQGAAFLYETSQLCSSLATDWLTYGQLSIGVEPILSASSYGAPLLWVMGSIPSGQWQALLAGRELTTSELGIRNQLKTLLSKWMPIELFGPPEVADWRKFANEIVPGDFPAESTVQITNSSSRLIKTWKGPNEPNWGIPEAELGTQFTWNHFKIKTDTSPPTLAGDQGEFEKQLSNQKFRYCDRPVYQVRITLVDGVELRDTIRAGMVNDERVLSYSDLSKDLRDQIWMTVVKRASSALNFKGNGGN